MSKVFHLAVVVVSFCLITSTSHAQNSEDKIWEFYGEMGSLLPDQIDGVTEIMPMWGFGVGMSNLSSAYSLQYINSTANGIKINAFSLETRKDVPFSSLVGSVSLGLDYQGITLPGEESATYYGGGHVGGGILALISSGLYVRMNMKFAFSPGVAMFLGFGLLYRPSEDIVK
jgi:hypothetical protein